MADNIFYVYELIDPRTNQPFYVGKGFGRRANHYFGKFPKVNSYTKTVLEEIAMSGNKLEVNFVKENLTEAEAIKLERTLIKKYGRKTKDAGGMLTNIRASDHLRITNGNSVANKKNKYTTIQIRKEIAEHIKNFCKAKGLIAATLTEKYWLGEISSSMSGSIIL